MALSRLDSLYMAVVADHSKSPHHHGVLPDVEQLQLNIRLVEMLSICQLNLMVT